MEKSSFPENKRVTRIKKILELENISQKDLADRLIDPRTGNSMEPQNFSRIMISGKVTEKTCKKIVAVYPKYRLEWLLGYDDSMTFEDWIDDTQRLKDKAADGMWAIIEKSLQKQGKSLRFVHRANEHVDSSQRLKADCYYSIVDQDENEVKRLTAVEMVKFEMQIQEYCDFITERHLLK